ncbi:15470_t:CDS:2 [Funneliformis geosporum]|uniref:15470_t:CDS:1 n=1 Tax=Funneliformis geosporum TaxID=1117311 RepID=A0A9W4SX27_9GLOM|nr:15470_t:CDS:2 [Funneliformis geosporum]
MGTKLTDCQVKLLGNNYQFKILGDANPRPIPDGQSFPSNGIDDDASKLNLNTLSRSDMTMLIPNLFTEKAQFLSTQISMQKEHPDFEIRDGRGDEIFSNFKSHEYLN